MKRYYNKDGSLFIENGKSKLRVGFVDQFTSDKSPGRVGKLFAVQEVMYSSGTNPIQHGNLIALSFPEQQANTRKYEWSEGEEFQIPVQVKLK